MPDESSTQTLPAAKQDVNNLKQTAGEAAKDLGDTAAKHASTFKQHAGEAARDLSDTASKHIDKAKGQAKDLAQHVVDEGQDKLDKVKGNFNEVLEAATGYIKERPLQTVVGALVVGFFIGLSRRSSR